MILFSLLSPLLMTPPGPQERFKIFWNKLIKEWNVRSLAVLGRVSLVSGELQPWGPLSPQLRLGTPTGRGAPGGWDPPPGFQSDPACPGRVPARWAAATSGQEPAEQVGAAAPPPRPGSPRAGGREGATRTELSTRCSAAAAAPPEARVLRDRARSLEAAAAAGKPARDESCPVLRTAGGRAETILSGPFIRKRHPRRDTCRCHHHHLRLLCLHLPLHWELLPLPHRQHRR